jgi:hypothetical protein
MSGNRAASLRGRACFVAVALGVTALVGCGGGSAASTGGASTDGAGGSGPGSSDFVVKSSDPVTDSGEATEIATGRFPNGHDTDEVSVTGAKPIKPCSLVSKKAASNILGDGVHVSERPQGPTCVYVGSGRQVSLVVEEVPLRPLREGARKATPVSIRGTRGWCIRYEATSVVVGVGHGRVLQVTGPCPAGVRFAAAALPKIPG